MRCDHDVVSSQNPLKLDVMGRNSHWMKHHVYGPRQPAVRDGIPEPQHEPTLWCRDVVRSDAIDSKCSGAAALVRGPGASWLVGQACSECVFAITLKVRVQLFHVLHSIKAFPVHAFVTEAHLTELPENSVYCQESVACHDVPEFVIAMLFERFCRAVTCSSPTCRLPVVVVTSAGGGCCIPFYRMHMHTLAAVKSMFP